MLTGEQITEIESRAQQWADSLVLGDDDAFQAAVEGQLARLTEPPLHKRRVTALALAEVGLTDASRAGVFRRRDTVSHRVFYDKNKDWFYGPVFRDVMERLIRLYRRWSAGAAARQATTQFQERMEQLRENEYTLGQAMFGRAREMVEAPLFEMTGKTDDGMVTFKPARWSMSDLPRVAEGASKLVRLSLGMAPGGRQEVSLDWTEQLPDGITREQADAVLETWARMLVASEQPSAAENPEDDDE